MTPEILIRSFTNDQYHLDKVFYTNYYKLKGQDTKKPVVMDIGSHMGYFVFTALSLGASKVYAFEPLADNYEYLVRNVQNWKLHLGRIEVFNLGVYTKDTFEKISIPKVENDRTILYSDVEIGSSGQPTMFLSLDTILSTHCSETIDILKINIGYAETEILQASKLLPERITSVCGETEKTEAELADFKAFMIKSGYPYSYFSKAAEEETRTMFIFSKEELKHNFTI